MKYVILCLAMLCCFALGSPARIAAAGSGDATVEPAAVDPDDDAGAETCGGVVCGKGQYCCNASCGICVLKGMSCTQQAC